MTIPNKQGLKVYQSFEVINSKLRCGWIKESDFDKLNNNTVYDNRNNKEVKNEWWIKKNNKRFKTTWTKVL